MSSETENYEENEHTTENVEENNEQANDNNGEVTTETPEPKLNSSVVKISISFNFSLHLLKTNENLLHFFIKMKYFQII